MSKTRYRIIVLDISIYHELIQEFYLPQINLNVSIYHATCHAIYHAICHATCHGIYHAIYHAW